MTLLGLVIAGFRFHWRSHLGALLGAALSAAVLVGALLISDSLQGTLRNQGEARIGRVVSALSSGERFFRSELAARVSKDAAPVLQLRGSLSKPDGSARVNQAQVLGVDARFWELSQSADRRELKVGDAAVSQSMADRLGLSLGESLVLRLEKPSMFSRDAPLSGEEEVIEAIKIRVIAFLDDAHFGRFSLQASQLPPLTVFLPLDQLQQRLDVLGKANLLLSGSMLAEDLRNAVRTEWSLEDAGLQLRALQEGLGSELRSPSVFLESGLLSKIPEGSQSLTYFVNDIRSGESKTPYSMVTAVSPGSVPFVPADLEDDEVVISQWLAEDLLVDPGQSIELKFYVMGAHRKLEERSASFRIREIVGPGQTQWDGSWMPDFPGLSEAGNCRDWKPGFALALERIRDKDEHYWKKARGTPKAFISLKAGQRIWENRWGQVTSVRYASGGPSEAELLASIAPSDVGFQFMAVRDLAFRAMEAPVDFAGLFGGFSFFLIIAALSLIGLLFGLMVERRAMEAGALLAVGWPVALVRRLFLWEGAASSVIGSLTGVVLGVVYARVILEALAGVWSGATGGARVQFYWEPKSILMGVALNTVFAVAGMVLACRRIWGRPARGLLAGEAMELEVGVAEHKSSEGKKRWSKLGGVAGFAGLGICGWAIWIRDPNPGVFFGGGSLCLVGALTALEIFLRTLSQGRLSAIRHLAWRNLGRRVGRALVLAGVLAAGAFLVLSVEVFRKAPHQEGTLSRSSGTGGFAFLGRLASPIYEDLNQPEVRDNLGLPKDVETQAWMIREKEGDEASCLNLNRAVQPRVLGVPSRDFERLGAFRFTRRSANWSLLRESGDGWVAAVADEASVLWALQKKLGDEIQVPDGRGGTVRLRLVGALTGSILQGSILIDSAAFERIFPDVGGYRAVLIDTPVKRMEETRKQWSKSLADRGLELVGAEQRLKELDAVANTYLSIFQVLGGLGVLLGAVGAGVVAVRNVVDRRGELAVLEAIGWRVSQVRRLLGWEHVLLVVLGIVIGVASSAVATVPGQILRGEAIEWRLIVFAVGTLLFVALVSVWSGIRVSLPRLALKTLQSE